MDLTTISILVVDGDAASRNYLASLLVKEGYQVLTASLGREGLISAWKDQPGMIVFDPRLPDLTGLEFITRLRQERRTATVPSIALSGHDDPQEKTALLAAGCSDYLVKSVEGLRHLFQYLPRTLKNETIPVKRGKLIVFLSAKGGVGTSSLCANIAMCCASARKDQRVALLDLVLPIGSIANIVGSDSQLDLISAAAQKPEATGAMFFKENLPHIPGWNFHLLAGARDPASSNQVSPERVAAIVEALLGSHDYLFVDLGRSLSRIGMAIIQQADMLVQVLGTDLATCTLTRIVLEYLLSLGVDPRRIYAIQNRPVGLEGLTKPEAEKLISLPIQVTFSYVGDNLTAANNRHEPFIDRFPDNANSITFRQVAAQLMELSEKQVH
jgi:CheY-like chemotaxis protein